MKGRLHIAIKRRREAAHEDEHLSDQEDHASDSVWSESDSEDYEGGVLPALISFPNSGTSSTWACVKGTMVDLFRRNADHTLRCCVSVFILLLSAFMTQIVTIHYQST